MKRKIIAVGVALAVLTGATVAVAGPIVGPSDIPASAQCELAEDLGVWVCTTTSTSPTTTTLPPTTTTTQPPTTTTTAPPTTTTTVVSEKPETIPMPSEVKGTGDGYDFRVDELDASGHPIPSSEWWRAPYFFDLPYADGFGWAAGDRVAYCLSFGFLVEGGTVTHMNPDRTYDWDIVGEDAIYGRFAVRNTVLGSDAYLRINDHGMVEGRRLFDGSPGDQDDNDSAGDCERLVPSIEYTNFTGPGETPMIVFYNPAGEVIEIRDYAKTNLGDVSIKFHAVDAVGGVNGRVGVAAYKNDVPGAVVYYDALNGGRVELFP